MGQVAPGFRRTRMSAFGDRLFRLACLQRLGRGNDLPPASQLLAQASVVTRSAFSPDFAALRDAAASAATRN
jgi:hypothetical protein